jgi:hypothetical protein
VRAVLILGVVSAGCGGAADGPLRVTLGADRAATASALRQQEFCRGDDPAAAREQVFPRCDRPGEAAQAWVWVRFDGDRLAQIRRWERHTDPDLGLARWNELVAARRKLAGADAAAERAAMQDVQAQLPAGTRSWVAWRLDADTVAAVYLLDPTPPEDAHVLEQIVSAPPAR